MEQLNHYTFFALQAAMQAGEILRRGFGTDFEIKNKPGMQNLVTEYDNRAEECIITYLKEKCPESEFLAEESGYSSPESHELLWIIDPLDGTVNFAHQLPIFAVSIAAYFKGELFCGVIYQPITQELFIAEKGLGSYLNGKRLKLSATSFPRSLITTGFPYNINENPLHCIDQLAHMLTLGVPIRRLGSAALDLAYVAAGRFDSYWEVSVMPWDVAAGILLVQEAGGIVTNFKGEAHELFSEDSILASNSSIHQEVLDHLNEVE